MSNVFRSTYRKLTDDEIARVCEIKLKAEMLYELLALPGTRETSAKGMREMALARTKLEECVMWATKAIT